MCRHDLDRRPGTCLSDGHAHTADHEAWSRRQFVSALGLGGLGAAIGGGLPVRAVLGAPVLHPLAQANSDRILVLVQLEGGNDGLNTIIPVQDDRYYRHRPTLGIQSGAALDVGQEYRLHHALEPLVPHISGGRVQTIHAVGYENPDLSHFRSTDIWVSASDADKVVSSGWIGRAVEQNWPEIVQDPPSRPLAVQIGGAARMFRGAQTSVGASFRDTEQLERLAQGGVFYDPSHVPATRYGHLMSITREIANQSYRYAGALQDASTAGTNEVAYPDGSLSAQLSIVARLINGGLGSRIYHVSLPGFDTHSLQEDTHTALLGQLAGASSAFMADLAAMGRDRDVLIMTFSEFGRTVAENGSRGTDHATVAPLFLMGHNLAGASFGTLPDLDVVNEFGDLRHIIDFRRVYATVLEEWLRIPSNLVDDSLGASFERLALFSSSVDTASSDLPGEFTIGAAYPNPASGKVRIPIGTPGPARLDIGVFDELGRRVRAFNPRWAPGGQSEVDVVVQGLPSGRYFVRIGAGGRTVTRSIIVSR